MTSPCSGKSPNVIARISFLLGLGMLIQIAFYFAGVYLLVLPLAAFAPSLVKPIAGVAILVAVGVTVQLLSMAMSSFRGIALYEQGERPSMLTFISQAVTILGHIGAIYAAGGLLIHGEPVSHAKLLIIAALYGTGLVLAIRERRQRILARA